MKERPSARKIGGDGKKFPISPLEKDRKTPGTGIAREEEEDGPEEKIEN